MGWIDMPATVNEDRRRIARGSMARANRAREKGHPCLVPWWSGNSAERRPFIRTLAVGSEYSILSHDIKVGPKPNLWSTFHR